MSNKELFRRVLWLIYAEEAREEKEYPQTFLYKIKQKVKKQLEVYEKGLK